MKQTPNHGAGEGRGTALPHAAQQPGAARSWTGRSLMEGSPAPTEGRILDNGVPKLETSEARRRGRGACPGPGGAGGAG